MAASSAMKSARKKANRAKRARAAAASAASSSSFSSSSSMMSSSSFTMSAPPVLNTSLARVLTGGFSSLVSSLWATTRDATVRVPMARLLPGFATTIAGGTAAVFRSAVAEPTAEIIDFAGSVGRSAAGKLRRVVPTIPMGSGKKNLGSNEAEPKMMTKVGRRVDTARKAAAVVTREDVEINMGELGIDKVVGPHADTAPSEELTALEKRKIAKIAEKADVFNLIARLNRMEREVGRLKRKCAELEEHGPQDDAHHPSSSSSSSSSARTAGVVNAASANASAAPAPPPPPPPMPGVIAGPRTGGAPPPPPPPMPTAPLGGLSVPKAAAGGGGFLARAQARKAREAEEAKAKNGGKEAPSTPRVTKADLLAVRLRPAASTPHPMELRSGTKRPRRDDPAAADGARTPVVTMADLRGVRLRPAGETPRRETLRSATKENATCARVPTMADIVGVRLRKVDGPPRSPGGTPMKRRACANSGAGRENNGEMDIASALFRKFKNVAQNSPESPGNVSDASAWASTVKDKGGKGFPAERSPLTTIRI